MFPGFASEFHKLDPSEREAALRAALDQSRAAGELRVIAGVADHATLLAERSAVHAVEMGAHAVNLLPPHFLGPTATEVHDHVSTVLAAVAPTPVILQLAPAFTGATVTTDDVMVLARHHENLRLVKVESVPPGPIVTALAAGHPSVRAIIGTAGMHMVDGLRRGAIGVQPGCSFTELYVRIWDDWHSGDTGAAEDLHRRMLPYLAYWMTSVELIVTVEKLISHRRGLIATAECRRPKRSLDSEEVATVDRFLHEFAGFLTQVN